MGYQVGRDEIAKEVGTIRFGCFVGKDKASERASCEDELWFVRVLRSWRACSGTLCFYNRCEICVGRFRIGKDIRGTADFADAARFPGCPRFSGSVRRWYELLCRFCPSGMR